MQQNQGRLDGACWFVTTCCNLSCPICYGYPAPRVAPLSIQEQVLERLASLGIAKIMLSGGEPLLNPNLAELARKAKRSGLKVGLSTNGVLLTPTLRDSLMPWIDEITIPIDGSNRSIHAKSRGSLKHFDTVLNLLKMSFGETTHVDASTVVSRFNIGDLRAIGDLIRESQIGKWKLFQFMPTERGQAIRDQACIPVSAFSTATTELRDHFKESLSIDARENSKESMQSYLFVLPGGEIVMPIDGKYRTIGSTLKEGDVLELLLQHGFQLNRHHSRHWRDRP